MCLRIGDYVVLKITKSRVANKVMDTKKLKKLLRASSIRK